MTKKYATLFFGIILLLAGAAYSPMAQNAVSVLSEEVQLFVWPSAEKAFSFGNQHFDAAHAESYDLVRAERLFRKARELDPSLQGVNHQLARIEFLRGNFRVALELIDAEINAHASPSLSSYYVRALIEGYMGKYEDAIKDYGIFLSKVPTSWAATNDLVWVLLEDKRYEEALAAIDAVMPYWPDNPWLLNNKAVTLYELGRFDEAEIFARRASETVVHLTEKQWSKAYPGNDPLIAGEGLRAFRESVMKNMHTIALARQTNASSVR